MDVKQLQEMQCWSLERKVFHSISVIESFMAKVAEMNGGGINMQKNTTYRLVAVLTALYCLTLHGDSLIRSFLQSSV